MALESFGVTAKPQQQHLGSPLLKHSPGSSSEPLQNTRHLARFDSRFMEPASLPSQSEGLPWNELFPWGQPGNFPGGSMSFRDSLQGWRRRHLLTSYWEYFLSLMPAEPFPLGKDVLHMVNLNPQPPRSPSTSHAGDSSENRPGKGGSAPRPGEP